MKIFELLDAAIIKIKVANKMFMKCVVRTPVRYKENFKLY